MAGIVALGKACEIAKNNMVSHIKYLQEIRNYYILQVKEKIPQAILNGDIKSRLPGNANFSFQGVEGEALLFKLDEVRNMCIKWFSLFYWRRNTITCINCNWCSSRASAISITNNFWGRKYKRGY